MKDKAAFAIGGVPPVGHAEEPAAFVDEYLLRHEWVCWAAAWHTHVVFGLSPQRLPQIASGNVVWITREERRRGFQRLWSLWLLTCNP